MSMEVFNGSNPTQLYWDILFDVYNRGEDCAPRGKPIKELRPVTIEFTEPTNRLTFLNGRRVNPFFQLAECLWILSGRSDVAFLEAFNKNMASFSDDGKYFNASYGERIRYFTKNDLHDVVLNPIDQLQDVYMKLKADPDTRQALIVISNPLFDNYKYTVIEKGKDIACNLLMLFKLRNGELDVMVVNRSNDLHWGLFGANLAQFSTIQEVMASWLEVKVGTYTHITDSLHIYLDDYGSKITDEVFEANAEIDEFPQWRFDTEPRMSMNFQQTDEFLSGFWSAVVGNLLNDDMMTECPYGLAEMLTERTPFASKTDEYWMMTVNAMIVYRLVRLKKWHEALDILGKYIPASQWKVSMLYFLKDMLQKRTKAAEDSDEAEYYVECIEKYTAIMESLFDHLVFCEGEKAENIKTALDGYLRI